MPTKHPADGHNVRVTRSALPQRARTVFIAALVAPALVLSACGADSDKKPTAKPSVDLPTGNVDVPDGVTLTKAGTALKFGETATVAYEPNTRRSSVLELTVLSVQTGRIADLAAYQLDDATKKARPYYARVRVKNVGTGDLSRAAIPLYAVDSSNALVLALELQQHLPQVPVDTAAGRVHLRQDRRCLPDLPDPSGEVVGADELPPAPGLRADHLEGHHPAAGRQAQQETCQEEEEGPALTSAPPVSQQHRPLRLGSLEVPVPVVLAPMAGITNAAYRRLCSEQGAGLYVCEMITSRGLVEGDAVTRSMLVFDEHESVRSVQLYGTDPVYVGKATEILCAEYGVAHVDLNFGCPVPKVTRKGGGAALPWKRTLLGEILVAAVAAGSRYGVPVTMKTRKGIDDDHLTYLDAGRIAQESGIAAIALHGRTAIQSYSGTADWDAIARLVEHVDIPVLGNGDIWEAADALQMIEQTGADGVVVGRGCLGRPWLFRDLAAAFNGEHVATLPVLGEVAAMMLRHAELLVVHMGEERGCKEFRKHVSWYLKGFPAGGDLRRALALVSTLEELDGLLAQLDPTAEFPVVELGTPRGRQGSPRKGVALPEGWLDDTDGTGCVVREETSETTGG